MQSARQLVGHYPPVLPMRHRVCSTGDVVYASSTLAKGGGQGTTEVAASSAGFIAQRVHGETNGDRSGTAPGPASCLFGTAVSEVEWAQRVRVCESAAGVPSIGAVAAFGDAPCRNRVKRWL